MLPFFGNFKLTMRRCNLLTVNLNSRSILRRSTQLTANLNSRSILRTNTLFVETLPSKFKAPKEYPICRNLTPTIVTPEECPVYSNHSTQKRLRRRLPISARYLCIPPQYASYSPSTKKPARNIQAGFHLLQN